MGWTIGMPSLKLNLSGGKSKHCGGFRQVAAEALEERAGHDPDINPELSEKNIYIGYQTAAKLTELAKSLIDTSGYDEVSLCSLSTSDYTDLKELTDKEIIFWDERLTTVSAAHILNETNTRGKDRKKVIDTVSACIILENYMNSIK